MEIVKLNPMNISGIISIYKEIARVVNVSDEDVVMYEPTKVSVSKAVYDIVLEHYKANGTDLSFAMDWCCYGPKTDDALTGCTARVEEGWYELEEEEE